MVKNKKSHPANQKTLQKKIFIAAAWVAVSVLLLMVIAQLSFMFYFNKQLKDYLQSQVSQQTKGEYTLTIDKLHTNLFNQSISLKYIVLIPDWKINPDAAKYNITAKKIKLTDFKVFAYLFHKDLVFDAIKFVNPSWKTYKSKHPEEKSSKEKFSPYKMISKYLRSFSVKKIVVINTDLNFYEEPNDSLPEFKSRDNIVKVYNLLINKEIADQGHWFTADTMGITVNNFSYRSKTKLYTFCIKKLVASSVDASLTMDSVQLIPSYSKKEFGYKVGKQTDRITISTKHIRFENMDLKLFFEANAFVSSYVYVDAFSLDAYRDKNIEGEYAVKKSLQQLIKSIPFLVRVDTIHVKNSSVMYEEVPEKMENPGVIHFDKINGILTGLTNDRKHITNKSFLVMDVTALLMNVGPMIAHYDFPLITDSMVFDCSAKLTDFPLENINPTVGPLAYLKMDKGYVDTIIFNFHADEKAAVGKMEVRYHDLKIKLRKHDDINAIGKVKQFFLLPPKRILAAILVKNNNPRKEGKDVRITSIYYPREPDRFIFSYTWKAILSGIKPAIGFPTAETHRINEPPPK